MKLYFHMARRTLDDRVGTLAIAAPAIAESRALRDLVLRHAALHSDGVAAHADAFLLHHLLNHGALVGSHFCECVSRHSRHASAAGGHGPLPEPFLRVEHVAGRRCQRKKENQSKNKLYAHQGGSREQDSPAENSITYACCVGKQNYGAGVVRKAPEIL